MKSQNSFSFSKTSIDKIEPQEKQTFFWDTEVSGLALRVSKSRKAFYFFKRVNGQYIKKAVGVYPVMTPDQARKFVLHQLVEYQKVRLAPTGITKLNVGELHDIYLEKYAKLHCRTWEEMIAIFRRYFKRWEKVTVEKLSREGIIEWMNYLQKTHGSYTANRAFQQMRAILNYGAKESLIPAGAALVCSNIRKFKETARRRFLLPTEVVPLEAALDAEPNKDIADFFRICLYTGARKGNVLSMQWSDIQLEMGYWTIPDEEAKEGDPINIMLLDEELAILRKRHKSRGRSPWVFPNTANKTGHLTAVTYAWQRVCKRAGIDGLHVHDLRRTVGSYMAMSGSQLLEVGRALGHKSIDSTKIYSMLMDNGIRAKRQAGRDMMSELSKQATNK